VLDNFGWASAYARAVLENDETQLERINEAESVILKRSLQPGLPLREFRAIHVAIDTLRKIRSRKCSPLYER
jgi:hypothetical protein